VIIAAPAAGQSHVALGPLVTLGDDSHFGLGARAEMDLSDHLDIDHEFFRDVFGSATATYSFQDCRGGSGCGWLELGGNLNVPVSGRTADLVTYVGAGFHIVSAFREESFVDFRSSPARGTWHRRQTDTSVGLNLIGGLQFEVEATPAFVEGKLETYRDLARADRALSHQVFLALLQEGYFLSHTLSMCALSLPMGNEHISGLVAAMDKALDRVLGS